MFGYSLLGFGVAVPSGGAPPALPNIVKSIQQVEITIASGASSNTATITSVTVANSFVVFDGWTTSETTSGAYHNACADITLTNSTTVTAARSTSPAQTATVRCTVVEMQSGYMTSQFVGKSLASGTASGTTTITSSDTSRTVLFGLGWEGTSTALSRVQCQSDFTNATTVTTRRSSGASSTARQEFCVATFPSSVTQSCQNLPNLALTGTSATGTSTITSVTTGNSMIAYGHRINSSNTTGLANYRVVLTNGTTVTYTRSDNTTDVTRSVSNSVFEFVNGYVSAQRGTISVADGNTNNTATITSVDTSKSFVTFLGETCNNGAPVNTLFKLALTNGTTVTATRQGSTATGVVSYEVITFLT